MREELLIEEYKAILSKIASLQENRIALMRFGALSTAAFYAYLFSPIFSYDPSSDPVRYLIWAPFVMSIFGLFLNFSILHSIEERYKYILEKYERKYFIGDFDSYGWSRKQIGRNGQGFVDSQTRSISTLYWILIVIITFSCALLFSTLGFEL
ncbi:MAG: hypothetical protein AAGH43_05040 [Pseudomonadota bacterium]